MNTLRVLLLLIPYLSAINASGQNIVPNSSFESGNDPNPNIPDPKLEGLANWENFGTSDWIHSGDPTGFGAWPNFPSGNTGSASVGFGACEGAQIELDYPASNLGYYLLKPSFHYRPALEYENEINLFLLDGKYEGNLDCFSFGDFNIGYHIPVPVLNPDPSIWTKFETDYAFVVSELSKPTYLSFRGKREFGAYASDNYMLIDDVVLQAVDPCTLPCGLDDGAITSFVTEDGNPTYYPDLIDGLHWIPVEGESPKVTCYEDYWSLITLHDANWVKLTVMDRWGNIAEYEYADPTGLHDANYDPASLPSPYSSWPANSPDNHFTVFWDGQINGGYAGVDTYLAKIEATNCSDKRIGVSAVEFQIVIVGGSTYNSTPDYSSPLLLDLTTCSGLNTGKFCSDVEINQISSAIVKHGLIEYGRQINIDLSSQWEIESNNYVIASDYIEINTSPDILPNTENPGVLDLIVRNGVDCEEFWEFKMAINETLVSTYGYLRIGETSDNNSSDFKHVMGTYPNPVKAGNYLTLGYPLINQIELVTLTSEVIYSESFDLNSTGEIRLRVPSEIKGMFILKVYTNEKTYTESIVVE